MIRWARAENVLPIVALRNVERAKFRRADV